MARYKLSQRIPPLLSEATDANYPSYPIEELFCPRFATAEQFAAELEQRLKKIPCPYAPTRAQKAQTISTFEFIDKDGLLSSIFEPSLISQLTAHTNNSEYLSGIRQIRSSSTSLGKKFRDFHVSLAKELIRHTAALQKLMGAFEPDDEWIRPFLGTALDRIVFELAVLRLYTKENPDSESKVTRELVKAVYSLVSAALKRRKVLNQALCHHLTSIICSPNCVTTGVLSPSPESVRQLLDRNPVKKPLESSN